MVTEPPSEDAMQHILLSQEVRRPSISQEVRRPSIPGQGVLRVEMQTQTSFSPMRSRFNVHPFRLSDGMESMESMESMGPGRVRVGPDSSTEMAWCPWRAHLDPGTK